jgi:hypothetical protein
MAVAPPSDLPQRLLEWAGVSTAAVGRSDDGHAVSAAVWLGWDAWVSPIGYEGSRSPSAVLQVGSTSREPSILLQ